MTEPSGCSPSRSFSMPVLKIPPYLEKYREMNGYRYPYVKNGFDHGGLKILSRSASKEIQSWYLQRDAKSAGVNIEQCGTGDVAEPYKIEALDQAALRFEPLLVLQICFP